MTLTISFVLRDFAEWTSIPGPIQIIYALNSFIRFLWIVIWLSLFGVFVYEFYLIVDKLMKQEAEIDVSIHFRPLRFPIVTLCNQNPYKLNEVRGNAEFREVAALLEDYERVARSGFRAVANDRFHFNNASTRYEKEVWAQEALRLLVTAIPPRVRRRALYRYDEMLKLCRFNNVPCHKSNFTWTMDATYGACFRFNAPNVARPFETFRAGAEYGLRLLVLVTQTDASGERVYLPTTRSAGLRILVDYEDRDPGLVDSLGLNLPVGRDVSVAMKLFKTELMPKPYGECVEDMTRVAYNLYPNHTYTMQSCLRSCTQLLCINTCGCADPRYSKPADADYCTIKDLGCLIALRGHRHTDYNFSAVRDCDCHPPCEEYTVDLSVSTGRFPSRFTLSPNARLGGSLGVNETERFACAGSDGSASSPCTQWFSENALMLNLWFRGLDVETKTQKSSYSISQASNDLGGQVSLWLGASVISVLEIITLVFMIILFFIYGRNVRVIPTREEYNMDPRYTHIQELKRELDEHERMDHQLIERIERQRRAEAERRADMTREIHEAHALAQRAAADAQTAHEAAVREPQNAMVRANAANALAVARATERHLRKLHHQYRLAFADDATN